MRENGNGSVRDYARQPLRAILLWGLPVTMIVAANFLMTWPRLAFGMVAVGFGWAGLSCVANALQCNRVHCWFAGPFMVVMSIVLLLRGYGYIETGGLSFSDIANFTGVTAIVLWLVPERILGKYFGVKGTG